MGRPLFRMARKREKIGGKAGFTFGLVSSSPNHVSIWEQTGGWLARIRLKNDFGIAGMTSQDLQTVVAAWQARAISKYTMFELFRRGEILPDGRTNEEERALIGNLTGGNGANRGGQSLNHG